MILKIENISINKLMPYENNARKHTEEDVQTIINSIQEFGFNDPVGVWGENNIIVEGHGRFLAAKKLGIKEIPCIRLDELSDEQRKAYTLAHNKTAEMSTWDFEKLEIELESISLDMSDFGFGDEFSNVSAEDYDTEFSLPDGDKPEICTMTFTLHQNQKTLIDYAMSQVENNIAETFGNTNKNGNALYEVVRQWAERKKLK